MLKLLGVLFVAVTVGLGAGQAQAFPTQKVGMMQEAVSGVTLTAHRGKPLWRRYPRYHSQYHAPRYGHNRHYGNRHYGNRHYRNRHYGHRHYRNRHYGNRHHYPYYRRYYGVPYVGWNYCGWGYGYWPYGCFDDGYYGGYYGDNYYYDRYYDPPRERVSNKKHLKWCKARYKTYNPKTDTFVGKGKKKYRCNSPYDGRR